jgi:hypothetical protein
MVVKDLKTKFGTWQIPWGEINRFQRLSGDINLDDDTIASLPIASSSLWAVYQLIKVVIKKQKKGMVTAEIVSCVLRFGDKIKLSLYWVGK